MPGLRAARAALCPPTRGALGVGGAVGGGPRRGHGTASRRLAVAVAHGVGRAGRGASRAGGLLVVLLAMRLRSDSSRHALAVSAGAGSKRSWAGPVGARSCGCSQALRRWTVHRQAASTEGAAQALQRTDRHRRLREALAGSRRRAVLQWRALDGRGRRARFGWGAARVVWWSS